MQTAQIHDARPKKADGRGKHLWHALRKAAPRQNPTRQNPYRKASTAVLPWAIIEYPGVLGWLHALYQGRASSHTVRDWIRGKRKPPQWAVALLSQAIDRRIAELQHAKEILEKEKAPS